MHQQLGNRATGRFRSPGAWGADVTRFVPCHRTARPNLTVRAGPSDVFVLDFDGVLVDSEPEVSAAAFMAAADRWPQLASGLESNKATLRPLMKKCRPVLYIAASKQGSRVSALLGHLFDLDIPEDSPRLFSSLLPPETAKADTLSKISKRPVCSSATLHFVDDRLETLEAIMKDDRLSDWKLYLAGYGYCNDEERARAKAYDRVRQVSASQLAELIKFGLIMGVDDGCEPSAEEVAAGVN
eukprot:gene15748-21870_t